MTDKVLPGPLCGNPAPKEAVLIHTKKVYDSCRDKDCLEDLRVYLTRESQAIADRAINVKPKSAHIIWVFIDVEPVPFNKCFYTVDIKYFYHITCDAFCGSPRPVEVEGLAMFDKRVVLFGSDGAARIFSSQMVPGTDDDIQMMEKTNLPCAVVEVVDPIALGLKFVEPCDKCGCGRDNGILDVPPPICRCFGGELVNSAEGKKLFVTLGQFTIVRLERDTQVLVPAFCYEIPAKECNADSDENPCDLFKRLKFPADEFSPPAPVDCENGCSCKR